MKIAARGRSWMGGVVLAGVLAAAGAIGAGRSPGAEAERLLAALPSASSSARITSVPVERARDALRRAAEARAAGDAPHAPQLEDLGLEWAQAASALLRAARAEAEADTAERDLADAEQRAARARALVEGAISRKSRAEEAMRRAGSLASPSAAPPPPASAGAPRGEP
ncbi:MAG: hypothetical protein IT376_05475 [Polyangiaceae bacterium]|nr:hypothetical protein [Polyangiaceae bacterium]